MFFKAIFALVELEILYFLSTACCDTLFEKNVKNLKWLFLDGMELKSYIVYISIIYDFHSTAA